MPDRRRPRKKAQLRGLLVLLDGSETADCRVEDVSAAGARIYVDEGLTVPPHCFLLVTGKEVAQEVNVVWVKGPELGLKFINTYPLESVRNTNLQFLRSLKLERLRS